MIELVRTTKGRKAVRDVSLSDSDSLLEPLPPIEVGRSIIEKEILESAKPKVEYLGIDLLDLRFKRINFNPSVNSAIYSRMQAERQQVAERFRSEGAGEAAKIQGNRDRDLKQIESEAYKKIQEIEGQADAKATEIYAKAYNQSPEALSLYDFTKSMDTLKKTMTADTTLILTTDSDFLKYLKSAEPHGSGPLLDLPKGIKGLPSLLDLPVVK